MEERLKFYDTGDAPRKNVDVMSAVAESLRKISSASEKPKKARKSSGGDEVVVEEKKEKKDKKDKKRDRESVGAVEEVAVEDGEGKKKKKKKVRVQHLLCPLVIQYLLHRSSRPCVFFHAVVCFRLFFLPRNIDHIICSCSISLGITTI